MSCPISATEEEGFMITPHGPDQESFIRYLAVGRYHSPQENQQVINSLIMDF
jgi:cold shock CspA family protein